MADVVLTDDYHEADYAILMVSPSSGDYFTATAGYLELDICGDKTVPDVDDFCRPMEKTHQETTLSWPSAMRRLRRPSTAEAAE